MNAHRATHVARPVCRLSFVLTNIILFQMAEYFLHLWRNVERLLQKSSPIWILFYFCASHFVLRCANLCSSHQWNGVWESFLQIRSLAFGLVLARAYSSIGTRLFIKRDINTFSDKFDQDFWLNRKLPQRAGWMELIFSPFLSLSIRKEISVNYDRNQQS